MDLTTKYHPRLFEEVVGHDDLVSYLGRRLTRGENVKLLLHGPTGTGKTTVALIAAKSIFCQRRRPSGSPCLECSDCLAFERGQMANRVRLLNAADHGRVVPISDVMADANRGGTYFVLVDEVHQIERKAADLLLPETDHPATGINLVLCTSNLDLLRRKCRPLIDRFDAFYMAPASDAALRQRLEHIAAAESLTLGVGFAEALVVAAQGSFRLLLRLLDGAIERGGTSLSHLDLALSGHVNPYRVLSFLDSCACGPTLASVADSIKDVPADAFRAAVEAALGRLLVEVASETAFNGPGAAFTSKVHQVAELDGTSPWAVIEGLIQLWAGSSIMTSTAQLVRMASETLRAFDVAPAAASSSLRPERREGPQGSDNEEKSKRQWLTRSHVHRLWHVASAYTQNYGETIRLAIDIGYTDESIAPEVLSRLTHAMAMAIARSDATAPLGWLYVNRRDRDGRAATLLLVACTLQIQHRLAVWLESASRRLLSSGEISGPLAIRSSRAPDMSFQISQLRRVAAALDPNVRECGPGGEVKPLAELLGATGARAVGRPFGRYRIRISGGLAALTSLADQAWPAIDPFFEAGWNQVASGWELEEYIARRQWQLGAAPPGKPPYVLPRHWPSWWKTQAVSDG